MVPNHQHEDTPEPRAFQPSSKENKMWSFSPKHSVQGVVFRAHIVSGPTIECQIANE